MLHVIKQLPSVTLRWSHSSPNNEFIKPFWVLPDKICSQTSNYDLSSKVMLVCLSWQQLKSFKRVLSLLSACVWYPGSGSAAQMWIFITVKPWCLEMPLCWVGFSSLYTWNPFVIMFLLLCWLLEGVQCSPPRHTIEREKGKSPAKW